MKLIDSERWIQRYKEKNALWVHNGDPFRPHALYASGLHGDTCFNSSHIVEDDRLLYQAAIELVDAATYAGLWLSEIECVAGPATGATRLSQCIAARIGDVINSSAPIAVSPSKYGFGTHRRMLLSSSDMQQVRSKHTLLCEDAVTTFESVDLAERALVEEGATIAGHIMVLVNRSFPHVSTHRNKRVISLVEISTPAWRPEECPLCAKGSMALRPKEHWNELIAPR